MALEQFGVGCCINCGFLGKRDKQSSVSECYEATAVDRIGGFLTEARGLQVVAGTSMRAQFSAHPWCFVGKGNFLEELSKMGVDANKYDKVLELLQKDRVCRSWYPYTEFRSPKEHFEEFKMLELERRREEFEQSMEKERKEFELRLDERNREERKRTDKAMKWLAIAAIIFALAEVIAAILGITADSWILHFFGS